MGSEGSEGDSEHSKPEGEEESESCKEDVLAREEVSGSSRRRGMREGGDE